MALKKLRLGLKNLKNSIYINKKGKNYVRRRNE